MREQESECETREGVDGWVEREGERERERKEVREREIERACALANESKRDQDTHSWRERTVTRAERRPT